MRIACLAVCFSFLLTTVQAENIPFIELKGDTDTFLDATFSPDGMKIVVESKCGEKGSILRIVDVHSGKELYLLEGDFVGFSVNGKKMIINDSDDSGDNHQIFQIVDSDLGKELQKIELILEPESWITGHTRFSPDGKIIIAESVDGLNERTIHIWDTPSGRKLHTLKAEKNFGELATVTYHIRKLTDISPDGKTMISANSDDGDQIWDINSGKKQKTFGDASRFRPLRNRFAGQKEHQNKSGYYSVAFSPDGKKIVLDTQIWDAHSGKKLYSLGGDFFAGFSSDGKKIVTTSQYSAHIYDLDRGKRIVAIDIEETEYGICNLCFSSDGKKIAVESLEGTTHIWDIPLAKELHKLEGRICAFSPDGKKMTLKNDAGDIVQILDTHSGKKQHQLEGRFFGSSPDGKKTVTVNGDTIRIWALP